MSDLMRMVQSSPDLKLSGGQRTNASRIGEQNDLIVSQMHGGLHEQSLRSNVFGAASQAATTTTVALATTYTGLCLSNPAGNSKNLIPRRFGAHVSASPGGLGVVGLGGGHTTAGVATHTTPLTTRCLNLGSSAGATGLADAAATLPTGPAVIEIWQHYDDDAALGFTGTTYVDMDGSIVIQPGGYVFVYTLTVIVGFFSVVWEEVPR